ncbi:hypothetical protein Kpho02_07180 [Kitasatospora phosalacinea]|uniref:Uncharacterized protein n=1 Tax=Kitasatospora phosalacinea TaxID=2065 RepID=A0A9W6UYE5_9ACTN|nr:hypothetical protein Kpho02_07180 [Kitasatospora phosalacinea]
MGWRPDGQVTVATPDDRGSPRDGAAGGVGRLLTPPVRGLDGRGLVAPSDSPDRVRPDIDARTHPATGRSDLPAPGRLLPFDRPGGRNPAETVASRARSDQSGHRAASNADREQVPAHLPHEPPNAALRRKAPMSPTTPGALPARHSGAAPW